MYAPRRETIHQGKPMTETDEFAAEAEDIDEDIDPEVVADDEDLDLSDDILTDDSDDDDDDSDDESDTDSDDDDDDEALDELEAEELEMLTEDESVETLVVDEAAEMRAIRRAELAMQGEGVDEASSDEFVCTSCYLVKRTSQLTNKRRKICADCAS